MTAVLLREVATSVDDHSARLQPTSGAHPPLSPGGETLRSSHAAGTAATEAASVDVERRRLPAAAVADEADDSAEPRESLLERVIHRTLPPEELQQTLSGIVNIFFLLLVVSFAREPFLRAMKGASPLHMELLQSAFRGFGTFAWLFALTTAGLAPAFAVHAMFVRRWIAVSTRETLYRVALTLHVLVNGKLVYDSRLSLIPSFALSLQTATVFMKTHSFFVEVRRRLDSELSRGAEWESLRARFVRLNPFLYFCVAPTLVYKPDGYPRSGNFRLQFFARKVLMTAGLLIILYIITTESILPVLERVHEMPLYEFVWALMLPCSAFFATAFMLMFEAILNGMAELTCFGDRQFYMDWWNASTLDEFSRKWNRPVHEWLTQHVYRASQKEGFPKKVSMMMTFLFSGIFHEWVLAVTFRRARMYLFLMMITQVPLTLALHGRLKTETSKRMANVLLWLGFFLGLSLLCVVYAREWYIAVKLGEPPERGMDVLRNL